MISILKHPVQVISFVEKVKIQEGADYIAMTNLPNIDRKMTNISLDRLATFCFALRDFFPFHKNDLHVEFNMKWTRFCPWIQERKSSASSYYNVTILFLRQEWIWVQNPAIFLARIWIYQKRRYLKVFISERVHLKSIPTTKKKL